MPINLTLKVNKETKLHKIYRNSVWIKTDGNRCDVAMVMPHLFTYFCTGGCLLVIIQYTFEQSVLLWKPIGF